MFLDSNVLYAAALGGGSSQLWQVAAIALVTNEYAAAEAWVCVNQERSPAECRQRLESLLNQMEIVPTVDAARLHTPWALRDRDDIPILVGAQRANCQYLITSDTDCFGEWLGRSLDGVTVLQPGVFMQRLGISKRPRTGSG